MQKKQVNDESVITELEDRIIELEEENELLKEENRSLVSPAAEEDVPEEEPEDAPSYYSIGEEAVVYNPESDEDIFGFKITKVTSNLTENSEYHTDGKPENTIEITYEYTNYSIPEAFIISNQFISAYDSNGRAASHISMMSGQTEVNSGRTAEATIWRVMDEPVEKGDSIEIEYGGDFVYGFDDYITYRVEIE